MADKEENLVRLAVYVSEEKRARFKAMCAIQRISMNQVIGDFLDKWLKENDQQTPPPPPLPPPTDPIPPLPPPPTTLISTRSRGKGRSQ